MQQGLSAPQFGHAPFVVMPVPQRNGLGIMAFFVALIGLVIPFVSIFALVMGLVAMGRQPRGFAAFGVMIALLGTIFWLGVTVIAVIVGLLGVVAMGVGLAGALVMTQPELLEITSDMANIGIAAKVYEQDHGAMPLEVGALALAPARRLDPWGGEYEFVLSDEPGDLDLVSRGPDGRLETDDDIVLSRLDRHWELAMDQLDERLEDLGENLERLEHEWQHVDDRRSRSTYERAARRQMGCAGRRALPDRPDQADRTVRPSQPDQPDQPAQPDRATARTVSVVETVERP